MECKLGMLAGWHTLREEFQAGCVCSLVLGGDGDYGDAAAARLTTALSPGHRSTVLAQEECTVGLRYCIRARGLPVVAARSSHSRNRTQ